MKTERWGTGAIGRSHTVARGDMVWSVSNATTAGAEFGTQVVQTLEFLDSSLEKAGSGKTKLLSVQVLLADISNRESFNQQWCEWIGENPENWPQRAVYQAALAPGLSIELIVTAYRS
jgi:enamine deaminase RidA (YjgF/YER057c/UK114 family)